MKPKLRGCIHKFSDWSPGARSAKWYSSLQLGAAACYFVSQSCEFCVASQRVFITVVVYFVIDSVRKLLDTPTYGAYVVCSQ
jgi:hypothetical protein